MAKIGTWSTAAGSNNSAPPDGWPEGQAPSTVNDCAREVMAQVRTYCQDAQWFDHGFAPTQTGANTFTVTGDQTSNLQAGRQLKLYDGAATTYRSITSATFAASTTVTLDAGTALTTSLSSFAVAVMSQTNPSFPRRISASSIECTVLSCASIVITGAGAVAFTDISCSSLVATRVASSINNLGVLSVSGATVLAAAFVGGTLSVSGATVLAGVTIGGTSVHTGAASFGSTVAVSGAASFGSTVVMSSSLNLAGAISIGSTAVVTSGLHCASTISAGGAVNFTGGLSVSGTTVLRCANASLIFDNTTAAGNINVVVKETTSTRGNWGSNTTNCFHAINAGNTFYGWQVTNGAGDCTANGNITAYSDERLKSNWKPLASNFVTRLAKVKHGTYDRIDHKPMRQVGVSAQSFQELMPEAVLEMEPFHKGGIRYLTVAYGNAALAACVELAKEVVQLRERVKKLEGVKS